MIVSGRLLRSGTARRGVALVALCAVGQTLAVIAAAALLATIISDVFARHASLESLTVPLVLLAVAITVRASMIWAGEGIGHRTAAALIASLRLRRLRDLLARGPFGLARERTGELATLLTAGLDSLDAYFARFVPQLLVAVAAPVLIVAFVAAIDWVSALILAVTLPLIPLFATLIGRAAQRHTQHRAESLQMLGGSFLDTLQGLPTLRVFGRGAAQAGRLRDTSARLRRTVMATLRIAFLSAFVLELLASLGTALLAVSIALRLVGGDLSLRGGLTVLVLAPEAYLPLRALAASFHTSRDGVEAARRLDHLTQTQTNQARVAHPLRLDRDTAAIALRDVTFAHPGGAALLVDVSMRVRAGERVVITGPSGAGKSTLLGLIAAQLAPDAGTLSVAPEPVSWLPQHPHVFSGTIAANVRLGNPGLSDADIEEWLARMDLHFACSAGTETGERGVRLSRGQRQRVALIRVLVRGSPMVLLDEPLAHLDRATRLVASAAIDEATRGRTTLIAAHSTELLAWADRIIDVTSPAAEVSGSAPTVATA